jgi:hypothetical protein
MTKKFLFIAMLLSFSASAFWAQDSAPPANNTPAPSPRNHQEPCWKQAGLSRSVMEQHRSIEADAHSQVASVCENSSLTPAQKQQQVREIHHQAEQKMNALITPEQQATLHACQQQRRAANGAPNGERHPGGGGPCGNFAASQGPANGRAPANNPQPPADAPQN